MQEPPATPGTALVWRTVAAAGAASALLVVFIGMRFVPPIYGRVVDAARGQPIEDVAVTLEYMRYHGFGSTETIVYAESTSGAGGRFQLTPLIGWSGFVFGAIGEHWLTINHTHQSSEGTLAGAQQAVLESRRSAGANPRFSR
jgi:hypothetical protein